MNFWRIFFIIFTYIFGHRDLDLWFKVTKFNRVWASAVSNHIAKTASKSVHPFGWNFVHKKRAGHTHRHTDKLEWKYNSSTISWRCKKKFECDIEVLKTLLLEYCIYMPLVWLYLNFIKKKKKRLITNLWSHHYHTTSCIFLLTLSMSQVLFNQQGSYPFLFKINDRRQYSLIIRYVYKHTIER